MCWWPPPAWYPRPPPPGCLRPHTLLPPPTLLHAFPFAVLPTLQGGIYHGRILMPAEYPFKPPAFVMLTPSGRFETGVKIWCARRPCWLMLASSACCPSVCRGRCWNTAALAVGCVWHIAAAAVLCLLTCIAAADLLLRSSFYLGAACPFRRTTPSRGSPHGACAPPWWH